MEKTMDNRLDRNMRVQLSMCDNTSKLGVLGLFLPIFACACNNISCTKVAQFGAATPYTYRASHEPQQTLLRDVNASHAHTF